MNFLYHSLQKANKALIWCFFMALQAIRPLLGPDGVCRYELSCTEYARMEFKDKPLIPACKSILTRFWSCSII